MEDLSNDPFVPTGASSISVLTEPLDASPGAPGTADDTVGIAETAPAPTVPGAVRRACSCGHGKDTHRHYRSGSDCSVCACGRFRRSIIARLVGR